MKKWLLPVFASFMIFSGIGADNAEAATAAIRLAEQEKVVAMIAPATSGNTVATVQVAEQYKVPIVTASGTAETVTVNEKVNRNLKILSNGRGSAPLGYVLIYC